MQTLQKMIWINFGKEIASIEGVTTATFKSNQEALDDLKKMFKENPSVIEGYSDDPEFLPNSYIVKVKDLEKLNSIEGEIEKLANVQKIRNQQGIISAIVAASKVINTFTGVITAILVVVSILIIVIAILSVCYGALSVGVARAITDTTLKYGEQSTAFTLVNFATVLPQITGIFLALSMGLRSNG